jgi:type II secretory pathway pseudopilin PulG
VELAVGDDFWSDVVVALIGALAAAGLATVGWGSRRWGQRRREARSNSEVRRLLEAIAVRFSEETSRDYVRTAVGAALPACPRDGASPRRER